MLPLLAFMRDTKLELKTQWKINPPGDVFSGKPVKIWILVGMLKRGVHDH